MTLKASKKRLNLFTSNFSLTYFISFMLLTILIMFMDSRYDYLKQIRKDFSVITSPIIIFTNDTINFFENFQSLSRSKISLEEEIDQLNIKINHLAIENQIRNFLVVENKNLREANLFSKNQELKKIFPAEIIKPMIRGKNKIITINKGSKDGIRQGMPALNREGLVGQIYSVHNLTSEIIPLLSKKFAVNALQDKGENHVIIYGDNNSLVIPYFPASINISHGDKFVTSGLDRVYPSGIKIGEVVDILVVDKQFNKIILKPATHSNQFSLITIIDY